MVSQSHIRLEKEQNYHNQICLSCIAGIYGCRWKRYRRSKDASSIPEKIFAGIATLSFICSTIWLYYWIIAENDAYDFNRFIAMKTHNYFNWFALFYALTIICVIYTGLLVMFALGHLMIGLQLHLHWSHKLLVILIILSSIVAAILLNKLWPEGFALASISLQITAPIIQILSVVIVTGLGWLVSSSFFRISKPAPKYTLVLFFSAVAIFLYLSPLLLHTPCLDDKEIPDRPDVMAHRGAPQLAPENTNVSFETALMHNVSGMESDVSISTDGQLFLLHDSTFEMCTDIAEVFPDRITEPASNFSWADIQKLDAGSWFLERDPFRTVRHLSEEEKEKYKKQKIMLLKDLLELVVTANISLVFDLRRPIYGHPYYDNYINHTLSEIFKHDIRNHQVWWLVSDGQKANYIQQVAPALLTTWEGYASVTELNKFHVTNVNAEYSEVFESDIRQYEKNGITSSIYQVGKRWIFSLFWCEGATSVTSSACQLVKNIDSPYFILTPKGYLIIWIILDVISVFLIVGFFLYHRKHYYEYINNPEAISLNSGRHRYGPQGRRKSDKELLFGSNKKGTSRESDSDSPVRTPQEMMNAADAGQKDSLPDNEVVGIQME